jgi:hypothetical protein
MALVARVLVAINAALAHPRLSLPAGNDVALHLASAVGAQKQPPQARSGSVERGRAGRARAPDGQGLAPVVTGKCPVGWPAMFFRRRCSCCVASAGVGEGSRASVRR